MSVSEITETRQYLTFKLGNEIFATDVAKVREVLDFTTITAIPRTPKYPGHRILWPESLIFAAVSSRLSI